MSCYILKTGVTGALYASTNDNGRRSVIAFKTKQQAGTYKRLLNEMTNNNKKHNNNNIKIEQMKVDFVIRFCSTSALDLTLFDEAHDSQTYEAENAVTDDIRFHLENKYRYDL